MHAQLDLPLFGTGSCFPRILPGLTALGVDGAFMSSRSIVVVGSNGKGSTARMVAALLQASGLRVGCFTSPHLFDIRERIQLNGENIPEGDLDRLTTRLRTLRVDDWNNKQMGAFEALYLIAAAWFQENEVDAIVWEAGIGGRLDATRTARAQLAVLTSVDLEHTNMLGHTRELIALDKVDALAPTGELIISNAVGSELHTVIDAYCTLTDRLTRRASEHATARNIQISDNGTAFDLAIPNGETQPVKLSLIGDHQVDNARAAILAAERFLARRKASLSADAIKSLAHLSWPGRLDRVSDTPELWIDTAHTADAVRLLIQSYARIRDPQRTLVIYGSARGKDVEGIARVIGNRFAEIHLCKPDDGGAELKPAQSILDALGAQTATQPDISTAARAIHARAQADNLSVLAFGATRLAARFQVAWQGGDPDALQFL